MRAYDADGAQGRGAADVPGPPGRPRRGDRAGPERRRSSSWSSRSSSGPSHAPAGADRDAPRLRARRRARRRRQRDRVPVGPAGRRPRGRREGHPGRSWPTTRRSSALRGRGPARRPPRAPAHRPAVRLLARARRRVPRVPPAPWRQRRGRASPAGPWPLERVSRLVDEVGRRAGRPRTRRGSCTATSSRRTSCSTRPGNSYLVDFGIATDRRRRPGADARVGRLTALRAARAFQRPRARPARRISTAWRSSSYELLSGTAPFAGRHRSTILRGEARAARAPRSTDRRPGLPSGLDEVLQRATASGSRDRYPDMADDDRGVAARRATGHRPPTRSRRAGGRPQRPSSGRGRPRDRWRASPIGHVPTPTSGCVRSPRPTPRTSAAATGLADELADAVRSDRVHGRGRARPASGKSSLVHAGLVPRLRASGDRVVTMVPGEDPLAQLAPRPPRRGAAASRTGDEAGRSRARRSPPRTERASDRHHRPVRGAVDPASPTRSAHRSWPTSSTLANGTRRGVDRPLVAGRPRRLLRPAARPNPSSARWCATTRSW